MTDRTSPNGRSRRLSLIGASLLIGLSAGCFEPSSGPSATADRTSVSANREAAGLGDQIAQLRAATVRFHDLEAAKDAGYNVALTACYEDEANGEGAMGYHYGKPSIINATVNQLEPEALLYEPQKNGRPRLVGVEYIVPFTVVPADSPPPRAFGLNFKQNFVFNVWALHVWVWKNNPSGIFADWNPNVTCDNAPAASLNISHSH